MTSCSYSNAPPIARAPDELPPRASFVQELLASYESGRAPSCTWSSPLRIDVTGPLDRGAISQPAVQAAFASARSGAIFISPTRLDPSDQVPTTLVGLPVVNGQGIIASVLVAEIDGRNLWRSIDAIQLGRTGRVFVASAEGIIIAHPERNYIGQALAPELRRVVENFEGQTEYHDALSDRLMLAAYSPVSGRSGWSIIVEQESIEALAPINAIAFLTMVVLLLALAARQPNMHSIDAGNETMV